MTATRRSPEPNSPAEALEESEPDRLGLPFQFAAVSVLLGIGVVRWRSLLGTSWAGHDESIYHHAFELVRQGLSPYGEGRFLYPPSFAVVGEALSRFLGPDAVLALRVTNLLGACVLIWLSLTWSRWGPGARLTVAALLVAASPLVRNGLWYGNVSPLFAGLTALGLVTAVGRPGTGGAILGSANALKPLSIPVIAVIATTAWKREKRKGILIAASAAAAGAGWLLLGLEHLPGMLARSGGLPEAGFNVSLARASYALGLPIPSWLPFVLVTTLACLLAWRRTLSPRQGFVLAMTTSLLALPVVNPSTLVLSYPAQLLALELALGPSLPREGIRRWAVPVLVLAAMVSVHGGTGVVAAGHLPAPVQAFVTLIPLAAVVGLTAYGLTISPRGGSSEPPSRRGGRSSGSSRAPRDQGTNPALRRDARRRR